MQVRIALFVILAALPACSGTPALRPREILDDRSGSTLSVVARPLVFARERSDVAANARDYATLVAVDFDQSGNYHDYMLLYRWSTVDPRMSPPPASDQGELRIIAEGRDIDLKPLPELPGSRTRPRAAHSRARRCHRPCLRGPMPRRCAISQRAASCTCACRRRVSPRHSHCGRTVAPRLLNSRGAPAL